MEPTEDEVRQEFYRRGRKDQLKSLVQRGSQTSADCISIDGKVLGRVHLFFPEGADTHTREQVLRSLLAMEIGSRTATRLYSAIQIEVDKD